MCTLVVYHRLRDDFPTLLAANREEFVDRPSAAPAIDRGGPVPVLAGRDLLAHGTWLGVTPRGFFVGLTNQRAPPSADLKASRGEVVMSLLRGGSLDAARAILQGLDPTRYRPFNLLLGDASALAVAYVRPDPAAITLTPLGPGVHVLTNDVMDSPRFPKARRARDRVPEDVLKTAPWPVLSRRLEAMLGDHTLTPRAELPPPDPWIPAAWSDPLQALCVHLPGYQTVSAAVIALGEGSVAHYRHAQGPPCVTPFVELPLAW